MTNTLYHSILISTLLAVGATSASAAPWWNIKSKQESPRKPIEINPGKYVTKVPRGAVSFSFNGVRFFFHTGIFYRWDRDHYAVASAPTGATVPTLPSGCNTLIFNDQTYYSIRGNYFRPVPGGYKVVTKPSSTTTVPQNPAPQSKLEAVTVWIKNDNDSSTPVQLTPTDDGLWIGPKGEYYSTFPSEAQLKPVYGIPGKIDPKTSDSQPRKEVIWIKNLNGSSTPVELEKQPDGTWKGPLEEIYPKKPSAEDLRTAYGLN
jgi:hypothetical protein